MKTKHLLLTAFSVLFFLSPLTASEPEAPPAKTLVTGSTKSVISIGIRYNGDRIDFFGSMEGTGAEAVVAKLTSPAETAKLNIKGRVGPFWMNTKQYEVENVPSMYKVQASDQLDRILSPELFEKIGIGFDTIKQGLKFHIIKGEQEETDGDRIFKGLLQLKQEDELYVIDDSGRIQIEEGKLFKHYFDFPSAAKPGTYNVDYFFIKDKKIVGNASDQVVIEKVGLEAFVAEAAESSPMLYGLCAVAIALGTGLLVGFIFKGAAH
jgi:uncharacterized protein (TIGR02186 family)